ncbi:MAG: rod shape-determining protein MreC [Proteobacteria bacterium]|nr:rod shape-determining protein MreC [Pseudomonadota bacterium]
MFSKKTVMVVALIILIAANILLLTVSSRNRLPASDVGPVAITIVGPLQKFVSLTMDCVHDIWKYYFNLISVAKENDALKKELFIAAEKNNRCTEIEISNERLRSFLNFHKSYSTNVLAAEVIAKDPSSWFKTIVIDKGKTNGVEKGAPVVVPEGIAGQIIEVTDNYSKVLLIIDRNSAVDALVQRTRARGIIKGESTNQCILEYVLRKHEISVGDTIVSSGLDGVYPKGLRIGEVSEVTKRNSGIFQEVIVTPYVDFEKLEEVLVVINP